MLKQMPFFQVFIFQLNHRAIVDKQLKVGLSTIASQQEHSEDEGTLD